MNWMIFSPELCCLVTALVFLFLSMTPVDARRDYIVALALTGVAVCVSLAGLRMEGELFHGTYRVDLFSQVFKSMLLMGLFLVVCISSGLNGIERRYHPEFYMLLTISTLAMMMLVSAVHILTLYVALELSSYSLYILVFLRKGRDQGMASGMKFFLIGASASATMLFGLALLYGATNAAYFRVMVEVIPGMIHRPEIILGLALTLCGFFFKMAVFPFHFWAPDVYEGAAHQVAAYISTASKVAVIAVLLRMVALERGGEHASRALPGGPGHRLHDRGKPHGHRPEGPQAASRLFQHRPCRIRDGGDSLHQPGRQCQRHVLRVYGAAPQIHLLPGGGAGGL